MACTKSVLLTYLTIAYPAEHNYTLKIKFSPIHKCTNVIHKNKNVKNAFL